MARQELMLTTEAIERLRNCLVALERAAGAPSLDIAWLRLRCEYTLAYTGGRRDDSTRQLARDIEAFIDEFPSVLPQDIVLELRRGNR
jgi:hypothetical protein